ncbi:tetratricopeptide repeat protein [Kitasatospora camelliae]|uniref:Tetratricopeptide repeat protein n=1 Tax=Kitasatospora camelliae TaxID=3156397 RepID=A0AAU8JRY4_9ACTN
MSEITGTGAELLAEGRRWQGERRYEEAREALTAAAEVQEPGAAAALGEVLVAMGLFDEAVPWLEQAALAGDALSARKRAILAKDRGDRESAERWYRTAASRDGDNAFGLAELLRAAGDVAGALEWYDRGAELGSLACMTNGATFRLTVDGDREAAEERLRRAESAGDHVATGALERIAYAWSFDERVEMTFEEDPEELREEFPEREDVLAEFPDRETYARYPALIDLAAPYYRRAAGLGVTGAACAYAWVLYRAGRIEEAEEALAEAFATGDTEAAYRLGLLHDYRGRLEEAEHWYRAAAERDWEDACWNLGQLLVRQRRLDEAAAWFGRRPEDEDFAQRLAAVERHRREPDHLLDPAEEARLPELRAAAETGDRQAALDLARLLDRRRDQPEAVRWYRRAFEAGDPGAGLALGRMLHERANAAPEFLLALYRPAAEAGDPAAMEELGQLHLRLDDRVNGEFWLRRAAARGVAKAAWWCGNKSDEYGDRQEAARLWAVAGEAGEAVPAFLAGRALVNQERGAEAEPLLRLAAADGKERRAPYWLGLALRRQGRDEEALKVLREALTVFQDAGGRNPGPFRDGPLDPRVEIAETLLDLGRLDECGAALDEVFEVYPGHRIAPRVAARLAAARGDQEALERHLATVERIARDTRPLLDERQIADLLRSVHP